MARRYRVAAKSRLTHADRQARSVDRERRRQQSIIEAVQQLPQAPTYETVAMLTGLPLGYLKHRYRTIEDLVSFAALPGGND